jgi:hypothetical protein
VKALPVTVSRQYQTWCIFGDTGVGKTALSATAPRPLIGDSNYGLMTVGDMPGLEHLRSVPIEKMEDLDTVYDNFTGTGSKDWSKKFDTFSLDHFDDIQGIILDALADKAMAKDSSREADQLEQREYGIMGNKLRRYLRKLKKLPKHKILICGQMQNYETGRLQPRLLGAMKNELGYFCDHVAYLRVGKKNVRYLHLNPGDEWMAKTRARWLTPEQRKIRVDEDNLTTLTDLFALVAAGPKGVKHKKRRSE